MNKNWRNILSERSDLINARKPEKATASTQTDEHKEWLLSENHLNNENCYYAILDIYNPNQIFHFTMGKIGISDYMKCFSSETQFHKNFHINQGRFPTN